MGLDQPKVVDAVGTDINSREIVLNIFDEWDWSDELGHLHALQDKINSYFEFIETGQIFEVYPSSKGRNLRINIIRRHPLTSKAIDFLKIADRAASELDVSISHQEFSDSS